MRGKPSSVAMRAVGGIRSSISSLCPFVVEDVLVVEALSETLVARGAVERLLSVRRGLKQDRRLLTRVARLAAPAHGKPLGALDGVDTVDVGHHGPLQGVVLAVTVRVARRHAGAIGPYHICAVALDIVVG